MREIKCYIKSMLNPRGVAGLLRHILNHISKRFIKYRYDKYNSFEKYLLKLIDFKNNHQLQYTNNSFAMNVSINALPQSILRKSIFEYLK